LIHARLGYCGVSATARSGPAEQDGQGQPEKREIFTRGTVQIAGLVAALSAWQACA